MIANVPQIYSLFFPNAEQLMKEPLLYLSPNLNYLTAQVKIIQTHHASRVSGKVPGRLEANTTWDHLGPQQNTHNLPCSGLRAILRGSLKSGLQQSAKWYVPGGYIMPLIFPLLILSRLSPCLGRMSFHACFSGTIYCPVKIDSWAIDSTALWLLLALLFQRTSGWAVLEPTLMAWVNI